VVPSADVKEIKRAFRAKAKVHHPDKAADSGDEVNSNFRRIKEAEEVLVDVASSHDEHRKGAFDQEIRQIRVHIVHKAQAYLREERYDAIDSILSILPGLREIKDLIEPQFDDAATREAVHDVIVEQVKKTKAEVNTSWWEKKYHDLNDTVEDLKAVEESLKCHSEVFPVSWNEGSAVTASAFEPPLATTTATASSGLSDRLGGIGLVEGNQPNSSKPITSSNDDEFRGNDLVNVGKVTSLSPMATTTVTTGHPPNRIMLVYPFPGDAQEIEGAAMGLREAANTMKFTEPYTEYDAEKSKGISRQRASYVTIHAADYALLEPGRWWNDALVDLWMLWYVFFPKIKHFDPFCILAHL
jgi:hypothetical protein